MRRIWAVALLFKHDLMSGWTVKPDGSYFVGYCTIECLGPSEAACVSAVKEHIGRKIGAEAVDVVQVATVNGLAAANPRPIAHGRCPFEWEYQGKRYGCSLRQGHHKGHELVPIHEHAPSVRKQEEEQRRHPGARVVVSKTIAEKERRSLIMEEALIQASEFIVMDASGMNVPKVPGAQIRTLPKNAHWSEEKDGPVLVVELRTLDTRSWAPVFEGTVSEVKDFINSDELRKAARGAMQNRRRR